MSLLTEIFINRTYNGNKLCDNIRLIGACNPYRKRKGEKEKCGLSKSDDNDNELVYIVEPLPQSLLYYVFSFGSIDDYDEKKYIFSIIEKLFSEEKEEKKQTEQYKQLRDIHKKTKEELKNIREEYEKEYEKDEKANKEKLKELENKILKLENKLSNLEDERDKITSVDLHILTTEAISQCHIYLRNTFDPSVVSLREIARFVKCVEFFKIYFEKKNKYLKRENREKNNKLRSIICSIYLCYFIRLTDESKRTNFEVTLRPLLIKLINNDKSFEETTESLLEQIKNEKLKTEIEKNDETINKFSDFLRNEEDFILDLIELDKGIGKNTLLKENVFLLFLSVITNIPLIIIGKPGTGKSLSAQLIYKSLRGKYSKNEFFQLFPKLIQMYFQGSESTDPDDVLNLFDRAKKKLNHFIKENEKIIEENEKLKKENKKEKELEELPIIMVLFDELGLAERSKKNPLKVLHSKLEYSGKDKGVSFIGISNYTLDAAKINRALVLSVPDLDQRYDEIVKTSENIVESISDNLKKEKIFKLLSKTYFDYKNELQFIKELVVYNQYKKENNNKNKVIIDGTEEIVEEKREKRQFDYIKNEKEFKRLLRKDTKIRKDFHGNRDFYNLIRSIANDLGRLGETNNTDNYKVKIIIKYIERNFGGIEYDIDIDFSSTLDDIREKMEALKKLVENSEFYKGEKHPFKLSSVYLFKKLYNSQFEKDPNNNLKIEEDKIKDYNLNKCINDNIRDPYSRYLLLFVSPSLTTLIYENIRLQNIYYKNIILYDGSPFVDDNNKEYRYKKINQIQDDAKLNKLVCLENLNQIHPFLFDLYNRNYIIKDEKKFIRICLDNINEQLTLVDDNFRILILFDERYANLCDLAFLNRLEKMILSFDKLLDNKLKPIANDLIDNLRLEKNIEKYKNINFSLKDLLINCGNEDIQGLIYYFSKETKNKKEEDEDVDDTIEKKIDGDSLKDKVVEKIYKVLPQDIICILPDKNPIRLKYNEKKNIYSFRGYIEKEYKEKNENSRYKISIIYTFTSISNVVNGQNRSTRFMITEIRSEEGLKNLIEEIKKNNEYNKIDKDNYICIHFQSSNTKIIKFVSNFILNTFKDDNYMYIFLIHINRNFNKKIDEKIYSLPDINPSINQIFIDNLNDNNNIKFNELLTKSVSDIIKDHKDELKLENEFNKILFNFLDGELRDLNFFEDNNDYINEIVNYINENQTLKEKLMKMTNKLIDEEKKAKIECKDIIKKMYENDNINKFTIDISSSIIDYIKNNILNEYLIKIFKILADNNIFATLYENIKNNFKLISKITVQNIIIKYLDNAEKKENYGSLFLFNYNIPGFYLFYQKISSYINKDIKIKYSNNEKKLRELLKNDTDKIAKFYNNENDFLNNIYKEVSKTHKFFFEFFDKIPEDLILSDYITYYLQKYRNENNLYKKDDHYHKLLEILLKIRFDEEKKIIKNNNGNKINILLIKLIWLESNINFIQDIFKIYENSVNIYNNNSNKLIKNIEDLIFKEKSINYITDKQTKHAKEVNECYYIFLASICYCITSDEINLFDLSKQNKRQDSEIDINYYYFLLTEVNKTLQKLSDDLNITLNEMYIIDELIKVIELFKKNKDIQKINEIKNTLRKNAQIIQEFHIEENEQNDDSFNLDEELQKNFDELYKLLTKKDKSVEKDKIFYDKIRYIFFKEIKKIPYVNYRAKILDIILEENEIIKKSNNIFQILLEEYLKDSYDFNNNLKHILNGDDALIKLVEEKLKNKNYVLSETLLYLFEKNSIKYLQFILNNDKKDKKGEKNLLEDEPLEILKYCIQFLDYYISKPKDVESKKKETGKLFSLGYIKVYIYLFIKMFDDKKPKFKKPEKIIEVLNGKESVYKMIRIYTYKSIYNNYKISAFTENKEKFKLKIYSDFNSLFKANELSNIYKIDYIIKTLKNDNYNNSYNAIDKYKKEDFNNKLDKDDFDLEEFGIDNFFAVSYNLILSDLLLNKSKGNDKFYKNICEPLFDGEGQEILLKSIKLFYDPETFNNIKTTYEINSNNIGSILFGYRICLNEIYNKKDRGIYYPLYIENNIDKINDKYYPGNDTEFNLANYEVINHFKSKPEEGCYVCLCEKRYYHSIPSFFPGIRELNLICPECGQKIGSEKIGKDIKGVKRDNYFLILKDDDEVKNIQKNVFKNNNLKNLNYMTLDKFKENYLVKSNEKGIYINNKNNLINDMKTVRNLSQISFRVLNYILYTNLFFARIIKDNKEFDKFLPKNMKWTETLYECWNFIKSSLAKVDIFSFEEFMNYLFTKLFPILNKEENIREHDKLIKLEDKLEKEINKIIKDFKEEGYKEYSIQKEDNKKSIISLLKEKYPSDNYEEKEYPFYKYFYYTDYLNEDYIIGRLEKMYENKYPVLKKYLENKIINNKNKYKLDDISLFNSVLNIFSEEYNNKISREFAEKNKLNDTEIYMNNKDLIEKFIKFYNYLDMKDENDNKLTLSIDSPLGNFFIDDNNKIGRKYKIIYNEFIKIQNEMLEPLLNIKINKRIYDDNCKIKMNIQQINEKEIFDLKLSKKISFTDILFDSSYRKILDSEILSNKSYREYEINYDMIEDNLTDLLLKNKKLLNNDITVFVYNNEVFSVQLTGFTSLFNTLYENENIDINDKVEIFQFADDNKYDIILSTNIVNDFVTLLKYLNNKRRENNGESNVDEKNKIYDIIENNLKSRVSENFIKIFENNNGLIVSKTNSILDYYLKVITENIINELSEYNESLNDDLINSIDNYFAKKDSIIKKKDLAYAIRIFSSLVLLQEKDKKSRILSNNNNLINYLKSSDLWTKDIYGNVEFDKILNELKLFNIKINQTISLYNHLGNDFDENYFDDVKKKIKEKEKALENPVNSGNDDPFAENHGDDANSEDNDPYADKNSSDEDN